MRLGLYYDLRNPGGARAWARVYAAALDRIAWADGARIGTAVVVSPLIPPPTLAEQAAVVDILSDGRLELGLGAGWREAEFAAFGADYTRRYEALEHAVRAL